MSSLFVGILLAWVVQTELLLYRPVYGSICEQVRAAGSSFKLLSASLIDTDPETQQHETLIASLIATVMGQYLASTAPTDIIISPLSAFRLYFQHVLPLWTADLSFQLIPDSLYLPEPDIAGVIIVDPATREAYDANAMLIIWGQIILLAIFTIWARTVGPRFRPDQLSDLTWKDLLLFLLGLLILVITVMQ